MDQLDRLFGAADDHEHQTIEDVALRAGLIWVCGSTRKYQLSCGWVNREDVTYCGQCGSPRGMRP